jgi:hypothetical protein
MSLTYFTIEAQNLPFLIFGPLELYDALHIPNAIKKFSGLSLPQQLSTSSRIFIT